MFTTDTRKPNCPIRIMYIPDNGGDGDIEPNGRIYASSMESEPKRWATQPVAVILLTEHGDYNGGDVEASNMRVLVERFPWLYRVYGSHGYEALAYDATLGPVPDSEELCEILENLEDYPLIDEDDHSALEMELETAAWEEDGRDDFRKALTSLLDDIDPEHEHEIPDDDQPITAALLGTLSTTIVEPGATVGDYLTRLWNQGCDELNVNGGSGFVVETGQTVYFYTDDWCNKVGGDKRYPTLKPVHDAVRKIAIATRITNAFQDTESKTQFSRGYDLGNYGNAYESQNWAIWSRRNGFDEQPQTYRDGMILGFFSNYELDEIAEDADEDVRDQVEALRAKHGEK